eukprot:2842729-Amphidinium_carterae.1
MQPQQLKKLRNLQENAHNLRSRRKGSTTADTIKSTETNVEQRNTTTKRVHIVHTTIPKLESRDYNYESATQSEIPSSMKMAMLRERKTDNQYQSKRKKNK